MFSFKSVNMQFVQYVNSQSGVPIFMLVLKAVKWHRPIPRKYTSTGQTVVTRCGSMWSPFKVTPYDVTGSHNGMLFTPIASS